MLTTLLVRSRRNSAAIATLLTKSVDQVGGFSPTEPIQPLDIKISTGIPTGEYEAH